MMKTRRISFIGLGTMGLPMATNLARRGFPLTVYNRSAEKAQKLREDYPKVEIAESARGAAQAADVLLTMLPNDKVVQGVVLDEATGAIDVLPEEGIHVCMSTISTDLAHRLEEEHSKRKQTYIAAPVFGRPDAAEAATLTVVVAGNPKRAGECIPLFEALGERNVYVGEEPAAANLVKVTGNFMIMALIETFGEAFALLRQGGVDLTTFLEIINNGLFKSPVYAAYGKQIAEEDFLPARFLLRHGLKDNRLMRQVADDYQVPMPLAHLVYDHLLTSVNRQRADHDWSALTRIAQEKMP